MYRIVQGNLRRDLHCYINDPGMRNVDVRENAPTFIKIVVNWWKILDVKSIGVDIRFNNNYKLWYKTL